LLDRGLEASDIDRLGEVDSEAGFTAEAHALVGAKATHGDPREPVIGGELAHQLHVVASSRESEGVRGEKP
jgi:hypothetical protein